MANSFGMLDDYSDTSRFRAIGDFYPISAETYMESDVFLEEHASYCINHLIHFKN